MILQLQAHLPDDDMLSATGFAIGGKLSYADAAIAYIAWFLRGDGMVVRPCGTSHLCALEAMLVDRGNGNAAEMTAEAALAHAHDWSRSQAAFMQVLMQALR